MQIVRKSGPRFLLLVLLAMAVAACGDADASATTMDGLEMGLNAEVPDDLDTATTKPTANGAFVATIDTAMDPLPLNEIHEWVLHVETPDGVPVDNAAVTIAGGMPQHNHGFPTEPAVTESLGNGDYRVEGVRFSMAGWWTMEFAVSADGVSDSVVFNVVLP